MSTPGGSHTIAIGPAKSSAMSSEVKTATTPGCASASDLSMLVIVAFASGERTIAACSIPGRYMSSVYLPWPLIRGGSSLRLIAWPTQPLPFSGLTPTPPDPRRPERP